MTPKRAGEAAKEGEIMRAQARAMGDVMDVLLEGIQEGSRRHYFEGGGVGGGRQSLMGVRW